MRMPYDNIFGAPGLSRNKTIFKVAIENHACNIQFHMISQD